MLPLTVRNNTGKNISGDALIRIGGYSSILPVSISSRSETEMKIQLPAGLDLSAGDNIASLKIPGEDPLEITFANREEVRNSEFLPVELPLNAMLPDNQWNTLRIMPGFPHIFFTFSSYGWPEPMWDLQDKDEIDVKQIRGLSFNLPGRRFIPVSHRSGQTSYKIDLEKHKYRKIYLLILPFVDNHDIFSEVARVTLYSGDRAIQSRTLHYPGDLDYWVPDKNPTSFSTYREPRNNRFELLPILQKEEGDWEEGKPPAFPQSRWWSTSHIVETESCLMNVVEINLDSPREIDYLIFESLGALPAFGIVGVTAEIFKE